MMHIPTQCLRLRHSHGGYQSNIRLNLPDRTPDNTHFVRIDVENASDERRFPNTRLAPLVSAIAQMTESPHVANENDAEPCHTYVNIGLWFIIVGYVRTLGILLESRPPERVNFLGRQVSA